MKKWICAALAALALSACGGPTQSADCKKYIDCSEAVSPGTKATLSGGYGPDGTCWKGTAEAATTCTNACKGALDALKKANPNQAACQ